jgi:hypothetical protein
MVSRPQALMFRQGVKFLPHSFPKPLFLGRPDKVFGLAETTHSDQTPCPVGYVNDFGPVLKSTPTLAPGGHFQRFIRGT